MAVSKVVVVDGNNLIVRIDRGVAGRGVTDVEPVEIDNALYLEFTFSDGTTETVGPVGVIQYVGTAPIVVAGANISLSTVPVNLGGTNATTAANARTNLNAANQDTTITAGTGLSGGGSLAANRTINIANTAVTAGAYGSASNTLSATVNAQGQLTALAATPIAVDNTQVSGLGTMSTQNANSVAITGGSVTGITDLAVLDGGTGASDASGARTNLGAAASATTITAGTGLSGGGDLSANRTLAIANTAVTAGSFGSASNTLTATVNAQGQLTALAATPIAIANTQVSGLGTASVLNAGVALGVATLDAGGTVPLSQIPASIQGGVSYQGSWNASTNTPTLTSSVGSKGYYYVVSVAGSTNLNGITDWLPGDWAIYNGTAWEKIDNTDTVASVNGYVGAVVLNAADVGAPPTTRSISTGTGLTGGGNLSADRTISIDNTAVSAGSYGSASAVGTFTVNAQGQLTAASNTTIAIANTQVSGLGTMSTQNANSVAITGGSVNETTIGATTASTVTGTTVTATTLVVNDNSTLGSSNSDTVSFNARVNSDIDPSTNNAYDLGRNAHAWRNLYLTGTANIAALTASGAVTLNAGTANGVAYLNGSKVLTTGSALTFDGTGLAVGGVFDGGRVTLIGGAGFAGTGLSIYENSTGNNARLRLQQDAGAVVYNATFSAGGNQHVWQIGNAEQMRLTSTGLGIGTSSPSLKLDVNGSAKFAGSYVSFNDNGYIRTDAANILRFQPGSGGYEFRNAGNSVNLAVLDASGNLGLGGAATNYAGYKTFAIIGGASGAVIDASTSGGLNAGGFQVGITPALTTIDAYGASGGTASNFSFRVGTYGNVIEGMRLTSTGLGIGTSSPNKQLSIAASVPTAQFQSTNTAIASGNSFGNLTWYSSDASASSTGVLAQIDAVANRNFDGDQSSTGMDLRFLTAPLSSANSPIERLRISYDGNVGIGTSSPSQKLTVDGNAVITSSSADRFLNITAGNTNNGYIQFAEAAVDNQWAIGFDGDGSNYANLQFRRRAWGSALTAMTLDSSGNLGIGTSSPDSKLHVVSGASTTLAQLRIGFNGTSVNYYDANTHYFRDGSGPTDRMILDSSGNLGIGTSSPGSKLSVLVSGTGAQNIVSFATSGGGGQGAWLGVDTTNKLTFFKNNTDADYGMAFYPSNGVTERMRLDSSGNLGLGVTPSAWGSNFRAMDVGSYTSVAQSASGFSRLANNAFNNNTNWIYRNTAAATLYEAGGGSHNWQVAPSGTAGDAISFSQAMTLDASGNLGVGTTSPGFKLHVRGPDATANLVVGNTSEDTRLEVLTYQDDKVVLRANDTSNTARTLAFETGTSERARITSGGQLLVGNTTTSGGEIARFQTASGATSIGIIAATNGSSFVNFGDTSDANVGFIGYDHTDNFMNFRTSGAEAMRITSGGALLVGTTTSNGEKATFQSATISSANGGIVQIRSTKAADTGDCLISLVKQSNDDTTSQVFVRFGINDYASGCGQINGNGSGAAAFGAFSDARLKENIAALPPQLANVMALRPVEFDYIASEGGGHQTGFIAQEMQQVYPDAIGERTDGMLTVTGWSKTEARLVKAIQEQQAIINSLKARLDAANL